LRKASRTMQVSSARNALVVLAIRIALALCARLQCLTGKANIKLMSVHFLLEILGKINNHKN